MHPFQGVLHGEHIQCDSVCSWTSQVPTRARPTSCGSGADAAAATHVASVPIHREAAPHSSDSLLISEALQDAPYVMTVWWATRQVPVRLRGRVSKIRIRVRIHVRVSARCVSIRYVPHRFVSLATDRPKIIFSKPGAHSQLAHICILVASVASARARVATRPHVGQFAGGAGEPENCFECNAGNDGPTA